MSRLKGDIVFPATIEVQAAAPLDVRQVVDTVADLLAPINWQSVDGGEYTYVGMRVSVIADPSYSKNGVYLLKAKDFTSIGNWEKLGAGSSTPVNTIRNLTEDFGLQFNLEDAIKVLTAPDRLLGQIITFKDLPGVWMSYQFVGTDITQYEDSSYWVEYQVSTNAETINCDITLATDDDWVEDDLDFGEDLPGDIAWSGYIDLEPAKEYF
jgi:hypothetical protein